MNKTMIMVDDFKADTGLIRHSLRKSGFKILDANNPQKALEFFDGREINLMVTDFTMDEMNGAELTKAVKLKKQYKNLPVLILSSEKTEQNRIDAIQAGAFGWMKNSFNIDRFIIFVDSIFR